MKGRMMSNGASLRDRAVVNGAASVSAVPASVPSAVERIIRPIVEGQVRSFINDHPEVLDAVKWFKPRKDKRQTLVNSITKRIVRDLLCEQTLMRLGSALSGISAGQADDASPVNTSGGTALAFKPEQGGGGVATIRLPRRPAQGIEARRAATGTGAVHESPVAESDAP